MMEQQIPAASIPAVQSELVSAGALVNAPPWRRWKTGMRAFDVLRKNPTDPEEGRAFTLSLDGGMYQALARALARSPEGQRLLADRPSLDAATIDLGALAELPEESLGGAFARHMLARGLRPLVKVTEPEDDVEYVAQWLYFTHDLWHVLTGYETDDRGEMDLQAFYLGKMSAPSSLTALGASIPHFLRKGGVPLEQLLKRWGSAYLRGRAAGALVAFRWDLHWATPLAAVRERLGVAAGSA